MRNKWIVTGWFCFVSLSLMAQNVIKVSPAEGDMTRTIQSAINKAYTYEGDAVTIELQNADYHIFRESSSHRTYYVSNTTSETENPDPTKHVGLLLKKLRNVTIDGKGARIIIHGEMSCFVIDSCQHITLKNFSVTSADPTVPEMLVTAVEDRTMVASIHPSSSYEIKDGRFSFVGHNWNLSGGIAQIYDSDREITWRSWSPLSQIEKVDELKPDSVRFRYKNMPTLQPGWIFQMRDGVRDEVGGLIQYSNDVILEDIHFAFLGNFGIVGQVSENITCRNLRFAPELGSGRTCAGFADFIQMSGCKGTIRIEKSSFEGSQDDPINVHGTHLKVKAFLAPDKLLVRYMHPQTYGFQSFAEGDTIDIIDSHSLLPVMSCEVSKAEMNNCREILLTLRQPVLKNMESGKDLVVENVSCTPNVIIRKNLFAKTPSRGILVTTRREVLIEDNTFFRIPMSAILIANDARSWFESGLVKNVVIRNNHFIECHSPVISVAPENDENDGCVHRNIHIVSNRFDMRGGKIIFAKSVDGLYVNDNYLRVVEPEDIIQWTDTYECKNVKMDNNIVVHN